MPERDRLLIDASAATTGAGLADVEDLMLAAREIVPEVDLLLLASPAISAVLDPAPPRVALISATQHGGVLGRLLRQQLVVPWKLRRTPLVGVVGPLGSFPLAFSLRHVPTAVVVSNVTPFQSRSGPAPRLWSRVRLRLLRLFTALCVRFADRTWALSRYSLESLVQHVRPRSVAVLPIVPPGPHNAPSEVRRGRYTFVVVADLQPHKGVEDAIQATGRIAAAGQEIELIIRGREMDPAYVRWLRSLAGDGAVRFEGPTDRRSAIELVARARALIHCSRMESLGRILTEAMSVGTPIVAAELPVTREVCEDAAFYYRPGDVEGLATLMSRLLWDDSAATELGLRGTKRMKGRSWLDAPRAVLENILSGERGAPRGGSRPPNHRGGSECESA